MERLDDRRYDFVLMLQPTSPLRTAAHVVRTARAVAEDGWDAAWTVSATDLKYHPLKGLTVDEDGGLHFFMPEGRGVIARQQLTPTYHRNGACYAFSRRCLLEERTTAPARTRALLVDELMISIDTLDDFARVEEAMRERAQAARS
jgi:CMP-N,N'-diacetyllegionaminic acid synthase